MSVWHKILYAVIICLITFFYRVSKFSMLFALFPYPSFSFFSTIFFRCMIRQSDTVPLILDAWDMYFVCMYLDMSVSICSWGYVFRFCPSCRRPWSVVCVTLPMGILSLRWFSFLLKLLVCIINDVCFAVLMTFAAMEFVVERKLDIEWLEGGLKLMDLVWGILG